MSSEKSLAIVLRVIDFSETSVVTTLFTRDFGKLGALAKGARRPKSPFEAALDLLAVCRVVFIHKSSDTLDLLTEARLERRFRSASRDLSRLYAGYYVAELLQELTDADDPHPELFDIANQTLLDLDHDQDAAAHVLRFETAALRLLGHMPSLDECVGCGDAISGDIQRIPFGQLVGGVLCGRCRPGKRQVVSASREVIDTLQAFSRPESSTWRECELKPAIQGEARAIINRYLENLLGKRLRMHRYLGGKGMMGTRRTDGVGGRGLPS
jgi:DNA repair protein RecO (recombination protein O)